MEPTDIFLSPLRTMARRLGLSVSTIYRLAESGKLELVKVGSASMVTEASAREYVAGLPKLEIKRKRHAEAA